MITKTKPTDLIFPMSLRQARITIRQLSQLPVIDFASLDRSAELTSKPGETASRGDAAGRPISPSRRRRREKGTRIIVISR